MLHTNFQGHRHFGSREEDFLRFLPYMGIAAILVNDLDHLNNLSFPHPMEAPCEIWLQSAQRFLRKRSLKMLNLSDLRPRSMNDLDH